jgi:sugar lactone lactonase YvrE
MKRIFSGPTIATFYAGLLVLSLTVVVTANDGKDKKDKTEKTVKEFTASHVQVATIDVCSKDKMLGLNSFCLDSSGNILAAVGASVQSYGRVKNTKEKIESGIRVFDTDGKMTAFWPLDFTPQAVAFGPDECVYVGGQGKIAKLSRIGKLIKTSDAPNLANREEMIAKIKQEFIERQKNLKKIYQKQIDRMEKIVAKLEAKEKAAKEKADEEDGDDEEKDDGDQEDEAEDEAEDEGLSKTEKRQLAQSKSMLKNYRRYLKNQDKAELSDAMVESMINSKSKISSISTTDDNVYVVCAATEGFGFDVWKTNREFDKPAKIIKGLRGCCGQMDVQARKDGLYVAENTGHRVVHYGHDGKKITTFGKRDASGESGFGSCCNPMNVCFGKDNCILTAESGTGRIMQFNSQGEKIGLIGNSKITGGCKNVAIHATPDLSTVYMLDLTGKKICVLKPKESVEDDTDEEDDSKSR